MIYVSATYYRQGNISSTPYVTLKNTSSEAILL